MSGMSDLIIEVAELVHVGNIEKIKNKIQGWDKDSQIALLLDAIEGNFQSLSLCDCAWCKRVRDES